MRVWLRIYDFFATRRRLLWSVVCCAVLALGVAAMRLRLSEDVMDFLPRDDEYSRTMKVYSSRSEAQRIVVVFEGDDPDEIVEAVGEFGVLCPRAVVEADVDGAVERMDYVCEHLPYFMTEESYGLLEEVCRGGSDTLHKILAAEKDVLSMPGTSFLTSVVRKDPLRLVPVERGLDGFTVYDGCMMTADRRLGFAFVDTPFGSTETRRNGELVDSLDGIRGSVMAKYGSVDVRLLGAPVAAVGNARVIKSDSLVAIIVSLVLIVGLLWYFFPRKRDVFLILLSVVFGWLVGVAALGLFVGKVSAVVMGIGAVLTGIAVNYPLHILVHQRYAHTARQTLSEVLSPLLTGNITTVGAFVALVFLDSPALRQLGVFAASLLLGTIVFCVLVLPHLMSESVVPVREFRLSFFNLNLNGFNKYLRWLFVALVVVAGVFVYVRDVDLFDADVSHINYMTEQQRSDFRRFEELAFAQSDSLYVASSAVVELRRRVERWNEFWGVYDRDSLVCMVEREARRVGFRDSVFSPFYDVLYSPKFENDIEGNDEVLAALWPGGVDVRGLNDRILTKLVGDFDWVVMVCSVVVFLFLCLSMRSVLSGVVAMLPMVLGWVWIFALMDLFGLKFNVVNIVLVTFVFGQGDDYSIFVVEGVRDRRRRGGELLLQYRQSIILSALIMFLAIGVLVFAEHPAMFSLGAVTLIGMSCVVCMAFAVPPILFDAVDYMKRKRKR